MSRNDERSGTALAAVPPATFVRRTAPVRCGLSWLLLAAGVLTLAWVVVTWRWQEPFSALLARHQQHALSRELQVRTSTAETTAVHRLSIAALAARYRLASHDGEPMGRIAIPRIGLNLVFVDGTSAADLAKGPGIYEGDFLPGEGRLVYIAGHRTTHGAPFANLNELRRGDRVSIAMPYGTFVYVVTGHRIVTADDVAVLRSHRYEQLILQTCHPRFSATHRYLVSAKPLDAPPLPPGSRRRP